MLTLDWERLVFCSYVSLQSPLRTLRLLIDILYPLSRFCLMHACMCLDWVLEWIGRNFASRWRLKRHICSYFLNSWFFCLWSSDEESLKIPFGVHSNRRARISALNKTGMCELRALIEDGIIDSTGREIKIIVVPPDGPQLRWRILYFWLYNNSEI